jgi:prevent-host-death family protein
VLVYLSPEQRPRGWPRPLGEPPRWTFGTAACRPVMWLHRILECGYNGLVDVGIRDLRDHLSRYIDRVRAGDELVITDRGSAVARLVPVEGERKLDRLIAEGVVTPAAKGRRSRPARRVKTRGTVSDLVAEQRR